MRYQSLVFLSVLLMSGCSKTIVNNPIVQGEPIDHVYEGVLLNPPVVPGLIYPSTIIIKVELFKDGNWKPLAEGIGYYVNRVHYSTVWDVIFNAVDSGHKYKITLRRPT